MLSSRTRKPLNTPVTSEKNSAALPVLVVAISFVSMLTSLLSVLNAVMVTEHNKQKIKNSKCIVRGTLIAVALLSVFCMIRFVVDMDKIVDFIHAEWNKMLYNAVAHSLLVIIVAMAFMLLIFDNNTSEKGLCVANNNSICQRYCIKTKRGNLTT